MKTITSSEPSSGETSAAHSGTRPPTQAGEGSFYLKICVRCKKEKPLMLFARRKKSKTGFDHWCLECHRAAARFWRASNPEKHKASARANYKSHKTERAAAHKLWAARNADSIRERMRAWRTKNAETIRADYARWRKANPETCLRLARNWRAKNRERVRNYSFARLALKRSVPGASYTTAAHVAWRWEMWGGRCWVCGMPATATDHVIALARGGTHWPSNLRPVCTPCNSSKKAKDYKKFLVDRAQAAVV